MKCDGELFAGPVEGFNQKGKSSFRKAHVLRGSPAPEIALLHTLKRSTEPEDIHGFC